MANYHRWIDRMQVLERQIRPSSVYLLLLVVVAFVLGLVSYSVWNEQNPPTVNNNTQVLDKLTQQLNIQTQTLASRNLELALAIETNSKMQTLFSEQNVKEKKLVKELAFYRSIMAPETIADGVAIHGLELSPSLLANKYRLKLILTQLQKRKQSLKGRAELTFIGVQDGEAVNFSLSQLTDIKQLDFKFRYFQVLETEITLPDNFIFSHVIAKVIVPSSRWTKGSQIEIEFSADELLPVISESSVEPKPVPSTKLSAEIAPVDVTHNGMQPETVVESEAPKLGDEGSKIDKPVR
ncbi:hypothetical protein FM038_005500 [Shewanella eurypsychrophilus]|uniref:MSHA biogenesis protein MshJ n=1 Tax=Shewanella eurypsychrophilus TaxID=2593656 RepID=A0ABX8S5I1_9GAMM|nr:MULTISPECIES: DUF6776 family protein [Shewanella]QXP44986.1 hypothetical protein FM038_005500 [Shewanella eurypsychrophilus]